MVALKFTATNYEPNRVLEPVPDGNYPVVIVRSDMKPTSNGNGRYLELEMSIQGGEYNGRKLFDRLNLENPNEQTVLIANRTLTSLCCVTNVLHLDDTQQLHGRPFVAVVKKQPRNDQPSVMTNSVKGYKNIDGSDPGFQGQVANPQAQPQWAQQAPQPTPQPNGGGQVYSASTSTSTPTQQPPIPQQQPQWAAPPVQPAPVPLQQTAPQPAQNPTLQVVGANQAAPPWARG